VSLGAAAASSESPFGSKVRKGMFRTVGQLYKVCFYRVIFCTLQNTAQSRGQNLVRFGCVFYFRNVKISTVVRFEESFSDLQRLLWISLYTE
jgi:hypothetical protein